MKISYILRSNNTKKTQQSATNSAMVKVVTVDPEDKGQPVRFQSGKYLGLNGWLDASQAQPPVKLHVIVDKGSGKGIYTTVNRASVANPFSEPKNQLESAVQQVALIEKHLGALCRVLIKCRIYKLSPELAMLIEAKLVEAYMANEGTKTKPALRYDIVPFDNTPFHQGENEDETFE